MLRHDTITIQIAKALRVVFWVENSVYWFRNKGGVKMNKTDKEKMLELIKQKQGGGRVKQMETPKNDRQNMRKGPKIFNK